MGGCSGISGGHFEPIWEIFGREPKKILTKTAKKIKFFLLPRNPANTIREVKKDNNQKGSVIKVAGNHKKYNIKVSLEYICINYSYLLNLT